MVWGQNFEMSSLGVNTWSCCNLVTAVSPACYTNLALWGQRARHGEEGVQPSLGAPLATLQDLLAAVTHAILTGDTAGGITALRSALTHSSTTASITSYTCQNVNYCIKSGVNASYWGKKCALLMAPSHSAAPYLNCFSSHMNLISPSSSGSFHLRSTVEQSTTSGSRKSPRASLYNQSSGGGYFCREHQPNKHPLHISTVNSIEISPLYDMTRLKQGNLQSQNQAIQIWPCEGIWTTNCHLCKSQTPPQDGSILALAVAKNITWLHTTLREKGGW